jgi:heme-degrading monooxygenase HmoA
LPTVARFARIFTRIGGSFSALPKNEPHLLPFCERSEQKEKGFYPVSCIKIDIKSISNPVHKQLELTIKKMIKRLVKLTFQPDKIADFKKIFETSKDKIRAMDGCLHLELLQDANKPNIFFTLSYWNTAGSLNLYRHSDLFETTWAKTKILFADKPEAWTTVVVSSVIEI